MLKKQAVLSKISRSVWASCLLLLACGGASLSDAIAETGQILLEGSRYTKDLDPAGGKYLRSYRKFIYPAVNAARAPSSFNITGISGTLSLKSDKPLLAALRAALLYNVNGVCPEKEEELRVTWPEVAPGTGLLLGYILQTIDTREKSIDFNFELPAKVPIKGCLFLLLDGGQPSRETSGSVTMSSRMTVSYDRDTVPKPAPFFVSMAHEALFGWAPKNCGMCTEAFDSHLAFARPIALTEGPHYLWSLVGDVSTASLTKSAACPAGPPPARWTSSHDFYLYPNCPAPYYQAVTAANPNANPLGWRVWNPPLPTPTVSPGKPTPAPVAPYGVIPREAQRVAQVKFDGSRAQVFHKMMSTNVGMPIVRPQCLVDVFNASKAPPASGTPASMSGMHTESQVFAVVQRAFRVSGSVFTDQNGDNAYTSGEPYLQSMTFKCAANSTVTDGITIDWEGEAGASTSSKVRGSTKIDKCIDGKPSFETYLPVGTYTFSVQAPAQMQVTTGPLKVSVGSSDYPPLSFSVRGAVTLTKEVTPAMAGPGTILTYRIIAKNTSSALVKNLKVTDVIPAGTEYVERSADNSGVVQREGAKATRIDWNLGSLQPSAAKTVSFKVKVQ